MGTLKEQFGPIKMMKSHLKLALQISDPKRGQYILTPQI